ncbi:uncharacterized protein LOC142487331 [Ascaphus truei]|uniref:uncharacterized protein LOC142487331 n=1 Tax=Ascaphus truei TaxID=8439 RepID=UPI003F594616
MRPLAYYSAKLDSVSQGHPSCFRAVQATFEIFNRAADIVMGHPLVIQAPHDIHAILNLSRPKYLTMQRLLRLQSALLIPDYVTLKKCTVLNPATLIPVEGGIHESKDHDCITELQRKGTPSRAQQTPFENPDLSLFTDGSRFADEHGLFHTGYAVTTVDQVIQAEALPSHISAQEAEIIAVERACNLAEGQKVNIYTDSAYAFGVTHDFETIWANRGFITASGTPVKHADAIKRLLDSLQLPKEVAVVKIKAHGKVNTPETQGNFLADQAAKQAALQEDKTRKDPPSSALQEATVVAPVITRSAKKISPSNDIDPYQKQMKKEQETVPKEEKEDWEKAGATQEKQTGLWKIKDHICVPRHMYYAIATWAHGPTHRGHNQALAVINKLYFAPGIRKILVELNKACVICQTCNPGKTEPTPPKHLTKPDFPFQRIQIDHIQMPKSGRYEYALVVVDMFSGWPEAYPVSNMTARTTAKKLITELCCRFGFPEIIESDQGPAFTASIFKDILQTLGMTQALHTPYHPQSSGKVERMNQTLKTALLKMTQESQLPWPDLLPIALFHVRTTPQSRSGLSPFEVLFGSTVRTRNICENANLREMHDRQVYYVIKLSEELSNLHSVVLFSLPGPNTDDTTHEIKQGDWVYVKKYVRKHALDPRYTGPHLVTLVIPTSVKIQGKSTWIHASHCKRTTTPLP